MSKHRNNIVFYVAYSKPQSVLTVHVGGAPINIKTSFSNHACLEDTQVFYFRILFFHTHLHMKKKNNNNESNLYLLQEI